MYIDNLTFTEARGWEELGIMYYSTIYGDGNRIHGISIKNHNYSIYMNNALDALYNRVTNFIYLVKEEDYGFFQYFRF